MYVLKASHPCFDGECVESPAWTFSCPKPEAPSDLRYVTAYETVPASYWNPEKKLKYQCFLGGFFDSQLPLVNYEILNTKYKQQLQSLLLRDNTLYESFLLQQELEILLELTTQVKQEVETISEGGVSSFSARGESPDDVSRYTAGIGEESSLGHGSSSSKQREDDYETGAKNDKGKKVSCVEDLEARNSASEEDPAIELNQGETAAVLTSTDSPTPPDSRLPQKKEDPLVESSPWTPIGFVTLEEQIQRLKELPTTGLQQLELGFSKLGMASLKDSLHKNNDKTVLSQTGGKNLSCDLLNNGSYFKIEPEGILEKLGLSFSPDTGRISGWLLAEPKMLELIKVLKDSSGGRMTPRGNDEKNKKKPQISAENKGLNTARNKRKALNTDDQYLSSDDDYSENPPPSPPGAEDDYSLNLKVSYVSAQKEITSCLLTLSFCPCDIPWSLTYETLGSATIRNALTVDLRLQSHSQMVCKNVYFLDHFLNHFWGTFLDDFLGHFLNPLLDHFLVSNLCSFLGGL